MRFPELTLKEQDLVGRCHLCPDCEAELIVGTKGELHKNLHCPRCGSLFVIMKYRQVARMSQPRPGKETA